MSAQYPAICVLSVRSESYVRKKQQLEKNLMSAPAGTHAVRVLKKTKDSFKRVMFQQATMFEQFGFVYLGPVDGHNMQELEEVLRTAKRYHAPVFIHVKTMKGQGISPGRRKIRALFHGVPKFDIMTGNPEVSGNGCYSDIFGKELAELAGQDERICAITAAMTFGTGLQHFQQKHSRNGFMMLALQSNMQ